MPRVEAKIVVPVDAMTAFAVSQTQGETRYRWDTFVSHQAFLDGAEAPAKGVRTETRSRHRLRMVSQYTSFDPPRQVGMKMVEGPWFFERFGGRWAFKPIDAERTEAIWRYTFTVRPRWLAPIAERIGAVLLGRDIRRRIAGYARGCEDPIVVEAARGIARPPSV